MDWLTGENDEWPRSNKSCTPVFDRSKKWLETTLSTIHAQSSNSEKLLFRFFHSSQLHPLNGAPPQPSALPYCIWIHSFALCIPRRQLLFHASHACVPTRIYVVRGLFRWPGYIRFGSNEREAPVSDARETRRIPTRRGIFFQLVSNNVLIVSLKRLPRTEKPVWFSRRICGTVEDLLHPGLFAFLRLPFVYFRVSWRKSLSVIYGSGNWNRQAPARVTEGKGWKVSRPRESGFGRRLTILPSTGTFPKETEE